ncbi:cytochrome b5-like [Salvia divinorum]|uniref:Cytochrome b5-like n=1 Tax=Salvia divinorum TaxID=28513 RepID=A0ABD1IB02_SALDI
MEEKVFSFGEVSKHNRNGDCWVIIHGKVYDVSRFLDEHPGGEEVLVNASGKDASVDFDDVSHTNYAQGLMKDFLIGKIDANTLPKMEKECTTHDASSSRGSTTELLLNAVPFFMLAFAFLLHYYNNSSSDNN